MTDPSQPAQHIQHRSEKPRKERVLSMAITDVLDRLDLTRQVDSKGPAGKCPANSQSTSVTEHPGCNSLELSVLQIMQAHDQ